MEYVTSGKKSKVTSTQAKCLKILKVLHAQLIFQLQRCPYDPKYIDLYRVNTNLPNLPSIKDGWTNPSIRAS